MSTVGMLRRGNIFHDVGRLMGQTRWRPHKDNRKEQLRFPHFYTDSPATSQRSFEEEGATRGDTTRDRHAKDKAEKHPITRRKHKQILMIESLVRSIWPRQVTCQRFGLMAFIRNVLVRKKENDVML